MHPLKKILAVTFTFGLLVSKSQNFKQQFHEAAEKSDTAAERKVLSSWATANGKDPELFIAYFNFFEQKARQEIITLGANNNGAPAFRFTDSTGKTAGYISSSKKYNTAILAQGFDYINQGLALYPQRLDMRFGKIYMLGECEDWSAFAQTIVEAIDYGNTINNAWLWKDGKPLDDGKEFFLSSLQDYVTTIYNTENDSLLPYMRQISAEVLKFYPQHVESLSNVALTYIIAGEYDKGLEYLLKAEVVNNKDVIVLNNIAAAYNKKGDKAKAKEYYEKIIKYGTKEEASDAKQRIKKL